MNEKRPVSFGTWAALILTLLVIGGLVWFFLRVV